MIGTQGEICEAHQIAPHFQQNGKKMRKNVNKRTDFFGGSTAGWTSMTAYCRMATDATVGILKSAIAQARYAVTQPGSVPDTFLQASQRDHSVNDSTTSIQPCSVAIS